MTGRLKGELKQNRPFGSVQEEVVLALLRTADHVLAPLNSLLRSADISQSQYNVLRILRGAGEEGLACGEISERMVRRDPDLTRLLDRLDGRGLVTRTRDVRDRRVVRATITPEGLAVLASFDQPVSDTLKSALAHVPAERLRELLDLLEEVRNPGD